MSIRKILESGRNRQLHPHFFAESFGMDFVSPWSVEKENRGILHETRILHTAINSKQLIFMPNVITVALKGKILENMTSQYDCCCIARFY